LSEQSQSKICAFFQTVQCERNQHQECEEVYGSTELNLEARCSCGCHSVKEIVPDSRIRARERDDAPVSQKQTSLESFGVDQFVKTRRDK
jgi:hypothetical protein